MKAGLVQMSLKGETGWSTDRLRVAKLAEHGRMVEKAAQDGVQVLGFQELFNQPYFCAVTDDKWFAAAEPVPDGPTVTYLRDLARRHAMVIVAPIFEVEGDHYYNTAAVIDADGSYLGKYRKNHIPHLPGIGNEAYYFKPSNMGYPVFKTAYCRLGVYICYDRHFPEGWRALALNGAQYVVNPSATPESLSRYIWRVEQPAAAIANGFFIGAINRVGIEAPWNTGKFYGSSYIVDPRGGILAEAGEDEDELVTADLDLSVIDEVRARWRFFETRQPGSYGDLVRQRAV
jgi:N-carbamoylputrescine amidase